jgi:hypothetical protein
MNQDTNTEKNPKKLGEKKGSLSFTDYV